MKPKTPLSERFQSRVVKADGDGCWLWTGPVSSTSGYGLMHAFGKRRGVHRIAWSMAKGEIPDGLFVLHRCDNKLCVRPEHLFIGTHDDNMRDKFQKGRCVSRTTRKRHPNAILTAEDAQVIRGSSERRRILAERYGVSIATISAVRSNRRWQQEGGVA